MPTVVSVSLTRTRVYPTQYEWRSALPTRTNVAYLTRHTPKNAHEKAYVYRFYFGEGRWSLGFAYHRAAVAAGKKALAEYGHSTTERPGTVFQLGDLGLEWGARLRSKRISPSVPSSLSHSQLISAVHDLLYHDSWHEAVVASSQPEHLVRHVASKRKDCLEKLRALTNYTPNGPTVPER